MATIRYTVVIEVDDQEWADEYGFGLDDKQAGKDAGQFYTSPDALNAVTAAFQKLAGFDPTVTAMAEVL